MGLPRTLPNGNILLRSALAGPLLEVASTSELLPIQQSAWAIAPLSGDDDADGTPAAPLRTGAEYTRRTLGRGLFEPTTLSILEPFPDPLNDYIYVSAAQLAPTAFFRMEATPAVLASGSFTGVTNGTANVSQTTVQSATDLSGFVGKRLRIISSTTAPAGTIAWIAAHAAGVSTLSDPCFIDTSLNGLWNSFAVEQLSIGDTFVIEEPVQCCQFYPRLYGTPDFVVGSSEFGGATGLQFGASFGSISLGGGFQLYGCVINAGWIEAGDQELGSPTGRLLASRLANTFSSGNLEGTPYLEHCSLDGRWQTTLPTSQPTFLWSNSQRNGRYVLQGGGKLISNNSTVSGAGGLSIHQWSLSSSVGAALHVQEGCFANLDGVLWGTSTNANTYGIRVDAYAGCVYHTARKPTISGALAPGKDVEVGGTSLAYADVPGLSANANNFAAIVVKN